MTAILNQPKTLDALYHELMSIEGKAEIINGELVHFMSTGDKPAYAAGVIFVSLFQYVQRTKQGRAVQDNAGFKCNLPHRKSFSPDAAFYTGPSAGMGFFPQPPQFAVEVRSENDYGPQAERDIAQKIQDYFAAGTLVVWDVDLLSANVVSVHRASAPATPPLPPTVYGRGGVAEAEPAVPGWTMPVDELFAS